MDLTEIYARGVEFFKTKDYGRLLDYVETGFIEGHDRRIIDRYTFVQQCLDAPVATTQCQVLGLQLATPVIMSAMTMPIPAIAEDALIQLAEGLKAVGSLMWTGTPIPANLAQLVALGAPVAANVKPLKDRNKMLAELDQIITAGVSWVGIEIDAAVGTKVGDREMGFECAPYSVSEIAEIKKRVSIPLVCKGVLSALDAKKCMDAGADVIVVSSHGGHTLDYLPHPFQVMEDIYAAVGGQLKIVIDGGFRRGSDVLKGLAFGADLIGLGRPILLALAADGKSGIIDLMNGLSRELSRLMTMTGVANPAAASPDILIERP